MKDQGRSPRKRTGGRLRPKRKKKKHELGDEPTETQVGDQKLKIMDKRGNTTKVRAITTDIASIAVDGETVAAEIENVAENDANPNYARRNIITKGAIIDTSEGEARVTSRPGQSGQVNATLIE